MGEGDAWLGALLACAALWLRGRAGNVPGRAAAEEGPLLAVWLCLVAGALLLALPFVDVRDPDGLGFRLRALAFIPASIAAGACVGALRQRTGAAAGTAIAIAALAAVLVCKPVDPTAGVVRTPRGEVEAMRRLASSLPNDAVVSVPERRLVFMLTWFTRRAATLDRGTADAARLRWLIPRRFGPEGLRHVLHRARVDPPPELAPALAGFHPRDSEAWVLLQDATFRWALSQLPDEERRRVAAWAPVRRW